MRRHLRPEGRRGGRLALIALGCLLSVVASSAISPARASGATENAVPPALNELSLRIPTEFGSTEGDDLRDWLVRNAPNGVRAGATAYAGNCAVCHGDTGLGYEEAALSFPTDHRDCTRCHRPGNAREMSFEEMMRNQHNLFDVGDAPAVRDDGALMAFPSDDALFAYLRATMPRYQPGRLSNEEYRSIVAFLRWIQIDGGAFDDLTIAPTDEP